MNRGRSIFAMWAALFFGAAPPANATDSRQTYVIGDFDTIRLEAPIDVVVTSGRGASAVGTGERDTLDALDLRSNGRTLVIRLRRPAMAGGAAANGKARLTITTGTVKNAALYGAGRLEIDRLKGDRGEASISGSGVLTIGMIALDRATLGIAGSGRLGIAGRAGDANVILSGAGRLDGTSLTTQRLRLDAEGSAEASIAASETATLTASGPVRITVTGKASCAVRAAGSAQVQCGGADY